MKEFKFKDYRIVETEVDKSFDIYKETQVVGKTVSVGAAVLFIQTLIAADRLPNGLDMDRIK